MSVLGAYAFAMGNGRAQTAPFPPFLIKKREDVQAVRFGLPPFLLQDDFRTTMPFLQLFHLEDGRHGLLQLRNMGDDPYHAP